MHPIFKKFKMKKLPIIILLLFSFITSYAQIASLKCYNNEAFREGDCFKCGIKTKTFSGIIVRYNNKDWAFYNPVQITTNGTNITFKDAFESPQLTIPLSNIATYNTLNKLVDFIKTCKCGDCGGGGGGGTDIYLQSVSASGNNIIYTMSNGTTLTTPNVVNKETIYLNGSGVPTSPTNDAGNRAFASGDKYLDTTTGNIYRYNGSSWVLIYQNQPHVPILEHFTLNGSGQATLSLITGFGIISTTEAQYQVELEGQIQYVTRTDFTVSGQTLTFNGGAVNAGQRGTVRRLY